MPAARCASRDRAASLPQCDDSGGSLTAHRLRLSNLTYALPPAWPFDSIRLVMEETPGRCDLYNHRSWCCTVPGGDPYVRDAIASILTGCHRRPCRAIDLGANNGWMAAYMLWLGAHVTAVEPQGDLARALEQTAVVNCWEDRLVVLNSFACGHAHDVRQHVRAATPRGGVGRLLAAAASNVTAGGSVRAYTRCMAPRSSGGPSAFRLGGGVPKRREPLPEVAGMRLDDILWHGQQVQSVRQVQPATVSGAAASADTVASTRRQPVRHQPPPRVHIDLIKLDGDGPEASWLDTLEELLTRHGRAALVDSATRAEGSAAPAVSPPPTRLHPPRLTVDAILVEAFPGYHGLSARTMQSLQMRHGYDVFRLAADDRRRLLTPQGWDLYSPPGSIGRLGRIRGALPRDELETELLTLRAMRRVYRVKRGLTVAQWIRLILAPVPEAGVRYHVMEFLLMHSRVKLLEPLDPLWLAKSTISPEARSANFSGRAPAAEGGGTSGA